MKAVIVILLALFCIVACNQQENTFTDTRNGKTYKTVKIGKQVWMAENLNYEAERSRCYKDSISYCDKYGRLYDWAAAMEACPKGWHLPSNDDWDKLYLYADGEVPENTYKSETTGKYLKSKEGWNDYKGKSGNGKDAYGFSALPGGCGGSSGHFYDVGSDGHWWSSSKHGPHYAYYRNMYHDHEGSIWYYVDSYLFSARLFSVRCVGD
ncbi:MAG: fibrobacter succinogenes major paralogous domain-containing protein [Fibromonadaceae bacterium]|jgi:uncharacterized protein (TIGR02145 family)|nr:fibrobacter succinogenes major paralogous domain-containing protein [Fibromonadaceae bacterium]